MAASVCDTACQRTCSCVLKEACVGSSQEGILKSELHDCNKLSPYPACPSAARQALQQKLQLKG